MAQVQRMGSYVLIVFLTAWGFKVVGDIQYDQCLHSKDNREALRRQVVQVATLGRSLVADSPEPNRSRRVAQFDAYQREALSGIPEIGCER